MTEKTNCLSVYLHIPFCRKKCSYCDFPSWANRESYMNAYTEKVIGEIESFPAGRADALYIGGGTPSVMPADLLERMIDSIERHFSFSAEAEKSIEMNPGTVCADMLDMLRNHGFNRISIGMQSGDNRLLRMLGRIHTWEDTVQSVRLVRKAGFDNLNLDLMIGLPGQHLSDVRDSLEKAIGLGVTHLSCYGLIVEEGTRLCTEIANGSLELPDTDEEREMYELCRITAEENGLKQYEISNFAKNGRKCRYNWNVWNRKEYAGFGCGAAGFLNEVRYENPRLLSDYLNGKGPVTNRISPEEARFESVMLGLRLTEGISEKDFADRHGMGFEEAFGEKMAKPIREGLLLYRNGILKLTRRGMDIQNRVLVDLM